MSNTRRVEAITVYTIAANRVVGQGNYIRQEGTGIRSRVRFRYRLPGDGRVKVRGTWELWNGSAWVHIGHYPDLSVDAVWSMLPGLLIEAGQARADGGGPVILPTCGDVLRWYCQRQLACTDAQVSPASKALVRSHLKRWLLPSLDKVKVADLSRALLESRLFGAMRLAGLAPSSQGTIYRTLHAAIAAARDAGMTGGGDFLSLRLADFIVGEIKPRAARLQVQQVEQVAAFVHGYAARKPIKGMLLLMMLAHGTRIGETARARWEDIDLEARLWTLPASTTKTRTRLVLPLTDAMVHCLGDYRRWRLAKRLDSPWLFTDYRRRPLPDGTAQAWVASAALGSGLGKWSAHDLRKLARTCWDFQGANWSACEALMNHAQSVLHQTYIHGKALKLMLEALEVWHGAGAHDCPGLRLSSPFRKGAV